MLARSNTNYFFKLNLVHSAFLINKKYLSNLKANWKDIYENIKGENLLRIGASHRCATKKKLSTIRVMKKQD